MSAHDGLIEQMMVTARDCITHDVLRSVNAVIQLKVDTGDAGVQNFFINLKNDGGSVERGQWSHGPVALTVDLKAEDIRRLLSDEQYYLEAFLTGRVRLDVKDGEVMGRLEPFIKEFKGLFQATLASLE
ncbi:hydroxysteroid dehydrogenase-like protein 2 [Littorina saxatilis]|uniref:SCP2 domain-containing protein n=1 Tax=Littorina saxatilis TaxID=31220 RepID=A0AAN9G396_9CAEN